MKKFLALSLTAVLTLALVACGNKKEDNKDSEPTKAPEVTNAATTEAPTAEPTAEPTADPTEAPAVSDVMSYADYVAAEVDTEVTVETYIQAKQGWWEKDGVGVATFYTQSKEGGYFLYDMPCTAEEYEKLVAGTKIKVTGFKSVWSGEVEIIDAKYEIIADDTYVAEAVDVTALLGKDEIADKQNQFVAFKGLEVTKEAVYKWDGSGSEGDDLYFGVKCGDVETVFTVESYLCGKDTDVYKAVKALKVGDVVDLEGFLYWYEGAQPHITACSEAIAE